MSELDEIEKMRPSRETNPFQLPFVVNVLMKSEGVYLIVKQPDGNWAGETNKGSNIISVRDIGPETVLQRLLTHDGK